MGIPTPWCVWNIWHYGANNHANNEREIFNDNDEGNTIIHKGDKHDPQDISIGVGSFKNGVTKLNFENERLNPYYNF